VTLRMQLRTNSGRQDDSGAGAARRIQNRLIRKQIHWSEVQRVEVIGANRYKIANNQVC